MILVLPLDEALYAAVWRRRQFPSRPSRRDPSKTRNFTHATGLLVNNAWVGTT